MQQLQNPLLAHQSPHQAHYGRIRCNPQRLAQRFQLLWFHTLAISQLSGLLIATPRLGWILGFAAMASLGLPGLAGFWGELFSICRLAGESAACRIVAGVPPISAD